MADTTTTTVATNPTFEITVDTKLAQSSKDVSVAQSNKETLETLLSNEYTLNYYKHLNRFSDNIATPQISGNAIQFYFPNRLNISAFTEHKDVYFNSNIERNYRYSPRFNLNNSSVKNPLNKKVASVRFKEEDDGSLKYYDADDKPLDTTQWVDWINMFNTYVSSVYLNQNEKIYLPTGISVKLPQFIQLNGCNISTFTAHYGVTADNISINSEFMDEIYLTLVNICFNPVTLNLTDTQPYISFVPQFSPVYTELSVAGDLNTLRTAPVTSESTVSFIPLLLQIGKK